MTVYRDELVRAVARVDAIDGELRAHRREVDELRACLAAPDRSASATVPGSRETRRRRGVGLALGAAAVATLNGAYVVHHIATAPLVQPVMQRSVDEAADRVLGAGVRALPDPGGGDRRGGEPLPLPEASQAATLRARCARTATDAEGMIAGMSRIDLGTCVGCDCCGTGAFPAEGDPSRFVAGSDAARCWECSAVVALGRAGIVTTTGPASSPLHGVYGVGFTLEQPARAFAIQLHAPGTTKPLLERRGTRALGLVAYDETGQPIDAVQVEVTLHLSAQDGPTLLVEACDGERIHRVDFGSEDPTREIVGVHVLPAASESASSEARSSKTGSSKTTSSKTE